jgi:PAS domain S-box-containing protein
MRTAVVATFRRRGRTLMIVASVATAAAFVAWWRVDRAVDRDRESFRAIVSHDLADARQQVEQWLQRHDRDAKLVSALANVDVANASHAAITLREHGDWNALWVFDEAARVIVTTATVQPTPRESLAIQRLLAKSEQSPEGRLGLVRDGNGVIWMSWLLRLPGNARGSGAVLLRADPSDMLSRVARDRGRSRTDVVAMVGEEYVILSSDANASTDDLFGADGLPSFAGSVLAGRDTIAVLPGARSVADVFAGAHVVPGTSLVIVRRLESSAADGKLAADLRHELAMASAALLPVLLVGGLAIRSTRRTRVNEIRRSAASYRSFVEHSPFGIYRSTADGRFTTVNRALVNILGYASQDELLEIDDIALRVYVDAAERAAVVEEQFVAPRTSPRDVAWKRKDGRTIIVRLSCRALRNDDGSLKGWEGFVEDVTPLREAEDALRHAESMAAMGHLLSGVAHELSNPITAILHFSQELERAQLGGDRGEAVALIREQAVRCREIVRDLLALARRREAGREVIEIASLVERVVMGMRPLLRERDVRVQTDIISAANVVGDRAGLEQVLTNLITNGADAAGPGGAIGIDVESIEGRCVIRVTDSGDGIPFDVRGRLFEPFFTTKGEHGTGLGLPVSLGIVEQHGGTLTLQDRPGERGACFAVSLPATALRRSPGSGIATPPRGIETLSDRRVPLADAPRALIVDDEPAVRAAMRRLFEQRGWHVDEASSAEEATAHNTACRASRCHYSLVLSDFHLPDATGLGLLQRLEHGTPGLADRFILCTGDPVALERVDPLAPYRVIEKPFDVETLGQIMDSMRR